MTWITPAYFSPTYTYTQNMSWRLHGSCPVQWITMTRNEFCAVCTWKRHRHRKLRRDKEVEAEEQKPLRLRFRLWKWRCFLGKNELHVSWQSIPDITSVFVRYAPCHASHPWLIPSLHLRGHAHSAPACTIIPGSDGGLMACSLYTAINLFIGHLPASCRYISACARVCTGVRRTINAIA